jgi:hypothetical protein
MQFSRAHTRLAELWFQTPLEATAALAATRLYESIVDTFVQLFLFCIAGPIANVRPCAQQKASMPDHSTESVTGCSNGIVVATLDRSELCHPL